MFKLIILFILVAVFSIFALNDFLGLWAYVREGLEYFNKVFKKHQMQVANCECPKHNHYKFSDAFKAIKESFKGWWDA